MKKRVMSFLLAFLLVFTLIPANANAAAARVEGQITVKNPLASMEIKGPASAKMKDMYASKKSADEGKVLQVGIDLTYTQEDRAVEPDKAPGRVLQVKVSSAGLIQIDASVVSIQSEYVTFELYRRYDSDAHECADCMGDCMSLSDTKRQGQLTFAVSEAGTYYLKVYNTFYNASDIPVYTNLLNVKVGFYPAGARNLKANNMYSLGLIGKDEYYRISVPKTSFVTISTTRDNLSYDFCNSSKKVLYGSACMTAATDKKNTYSLSKGTYYIKVKGQYRNEILTLKYTTASELTAKNDKWVTMNPSSNKVTTYVKLKATADGYIKVNLRNAKGDDTSAYITLCNSNKKTVTNKTWIDSSSKYNTYLVYGVKKNKTYYLKVTHASGRTVIKYKQTAVSEKSGSSKKKAVTLKSGKTVKGTIGVGDTKSDWYKITVTKSKKIKFYVTGNANGTLKMQIYKSNGRKFGSALTVINGINQKVTLKSTDGNGKMPAGTYYFRIFRANTKSTGNYSLKWK